MMAWNCDAIPLAGSSEKWRSPPIESAGQLSGQPAPPQPEALAGAQRLSPPCGWGVLDSDTVRGSSRLRGRQTPRKLALSLGFAALLVPLCFGQANLAKLTGIVTDTGEGVIPGAEVSVFNTGTGISRDQTSGAVGSFTFAALIPGDCELIVTSEGFQQHV